MPQETAFIAQAFARKDNKLEPGQMLPFRPAEAGGYGLSYFSSWWSS